MASTLLPLYTHVSKQTIAIQRELDATHLMYEALNRYLTEGIYHSKTEERGNLRYLISWEEGYEGEPIKVCISYENTFKEKEQKCEVLE